MTPKIIPVLLFLLFFSAAGFAEPKHLTYKEIAQATPAGDSPYERFKKAGQEKPVSKLLKRNLLERQSKRWLINFFHQLRQGFKDEQKPPTENK